MLQVVQESWGTFSLVEWHFLTSTGGASVERNGKNLNLFSQVFLVVR